MMTASGEVNIRLNSTAGVPSKAIETSWLVAMMVNMNKGTGRASDRFLK